MRLLFADPALGDLEAIEAHIAYDDPDAAVRTVLAVLEAVDVRSEHPNIGRPGRMSGTRELVVSPLPFIAIYRVQQNTVWILRVLHGARRWPSESQ